MLAILVVVTMAGAAPPGTPELINGQAQSFRSVGGLAIYEGEARLWAAGMAVDARRITYDRQREVVTAVGGVVARFAQAGLLAITADVVTVRLSGARVDEVFILDGTAVAKKDTTAEQLLAARTGDELARAGAVQALLEGNHLVRDGPRWTAEAITLVPCECNFTSPSYSVWAPSGTLDPAEDRVSLVSPVVRVFGVPVLWLPWISLPLSSRASGLLFPRPSYTTLNGVSVEVPVFLTLGDSADLTLTPGYFTGSLDPVRPPFGIAGPRLSGELRYVPSPRVSGRLVGSLVWDTRAARDPLNPLYTGVPGTPPAGRGMRGEVAVQHVHDLEGGVGIRVDGTAYSDGFYNRDLVPDVLGSTVGYLRSAAAVSWRGPRHVVAADAVLRQDLTSGFTLLGEARRPAGSSAPRFGPGTLHRLPAVTAWIPRVSVAGPLAAGGEAEVVRLAPLSSLTGDEGVSAREGSALDAAGAEEPVSCRVARLYGAATAGCASGPVAKDGMGDRRWQPGEREARLRFTAVPRLELAGLAGGVVGLEASAWWRHSAWLGEASGRAWHHGGLVVDASARARLEGGWGAVRHVIEPVIRARAVPVMVRGGPGSPVAYDEVDAALPPGDGPVAQLAVELEQRLSARGSPVEVRLDLGQGAWLVQPGQAVPYLAESYGRLAARLGWLSVNGEARVDPQVPRLTRLSGALRLDSGKGHALYAGYENVLDDGTNRTRAPVDLLFGVAVPATFTDRSQLVTAGGALALGPVGLRYDLLLTQRRLPVRDATGAELRTDTVLALAQHTVGVSLAPACDCWRLEVFATQRLQVVDGAPSLTFPDFGASLTVSRFGSIGVTR